MQKPIAKELVKIKRVNFALSRRFFVIYSVNFYFLDSRLSIDFL